MRLYDESEGYVSYCNNFDRPYTVIGNKIIGFFLWQKFTLTYEISDDTLTLVGPLEDFEESKTIILIRADKSDINGAEGGPCQ